MKLIFAFLAFAAAKFSDFVNDINYDNWKQELMSNPLETNYFVIFVDQNCKQCRRGASNLMKLGQKLDKVKIGRVDCKLSNGICDTFRVNSLSHMLLLTKKHVY
jgi:thioredoxin-like negative regulator of GroEL